MMVSFLIPSKSWPMSRDGLTGKVTKALIISRVKRDCLAKQEGTKW
ncbi:hypothetical protein LINPERPRIM_LOCUS24070, partial [Linum perenne]